MAVYITVPLTKDSTLLDKAIESLIDEADRYRLQDDRGWLIRFKGTSVELSNRIGLTRQENGDPVLVGSAIIVPISSYYGRGSVDMWEWLKNRLENG